MSAGALQVIRRQAFKALPWKNGGGTTYEALRVPASGDPFEYRVSVARIDASGPFSEFAGHDRKMVLLEGRGVILHFADGRTTTLATAGDLIEFDGAIPAHAELLGGACLDLNLMVLKGRPAECAVARLSRRHLAGSAGVTLIFPVDRAVTLVADSGESGTLERGDLGVLNEAGGRLETSDGSEALVFIATLGG